MASNKIIYGINLGATNSAIARFENGKAIIKKNPNLKDTTPSCVYVTPKAQIIAGQSAYNQLKRETVLAKTSKDGYKRNAFVEFMRLMGTNETFFSSNLEKNGINPVLTPEQLSAEVLKTLRSYIQDDDVKEAVITIPAFFNDSQKDATKRAAKLAGFDYFKLIQEPIAASMAYGFDSKMKNYWLVFDLGSKTFNVALMKIENGIMAVMDTAGNNHLGGKDIDNAIVEKIIMPYLHGKYSLDGYAENESFKGVWKSIAEEIKIALSFNGSYMLETDLGEDYGCDKNGEELELALEISQYDLEPVERPIFQKAIDITNKLLKKNNLSSEQLGTLMLVGGPTHSPFLRQMLKEQVTPNVDTSIDPVTAVACGAALYGSTIDVPKEIINSRRNRPKIQLEIMVESTSVEDYEYAAVKFLKDKSESYSENSVFVDFVRKDSSFSTDKLQISEAGDVVQLRLQHDSTNIFTILCYDSFGNKLDCEPSSVSIIHGIDGVGTKDENDDIVFIPQEGLKKNFF